MKTYKFVKATEVINAHVLMTDESGAVWSVPADPANSDYAEYLRYTEWVEAGNDPDEFWTQTEAI